MVYESLKPPNTCHLGALHGRNCLLHDLSDPSSEVYEIS